MQHPVQPSTDPHLYFQKQQLFSANNEHTCYEFKLEFFIWNLWIWGYSGKRPEKKKKKSCQGFSKQLHNPLFIWGVDPAIHSMFAVVSSAKLVPTATVIPEQSLLHWWSVTTRFVLSVSCHRLHGDRNKHLQSTWPNEGGGLQLTAVSRLEGSGRTLAGTQASHLPKEFLSKRVS